MHNKKIWIIVLVMFLLLLAPIFYSQSPSKSIEIDLQTILENEDFSINGLPWFSTFNDNKLVNRSDAVKQLTGATTFELHFASMKIIDTDANVSGIFIFPQLPRDKGNFQLVKISLELVFQNEDSYKHFLKIFEKSLINAATINTSLRSASTGDDLLSPLQQLQQEFSTAKWYGANFLEDLNGKYFIELESQPSDFINLGVDTWRNVILRFGVELD